MRSGEDVMDAFREELDTVEAEIVKLSGQITVMKKEKKKLKLRRKVLKECLSAMSEKEAE